jgi:integrase
MASVTQYRDGWRAVVRRIGYPVTSKTFKLKKDADAWSREIESSMDNNKYRDLAKAKEHTVGAIFERFRDEVCDSRKGGRWDKVRINHLIKTAEFAKRRLDQLKFEDVRDWRDARLKQVSAPSVNREMNLISGIFRHAIEEWSVPMSANPVHMVSRPKGSDRQRNRRWRDHELQAVLDAAKWDEAVKPKTGKDMVPWALLVALETAMRPSELAALRVGDFLPEERCARLLDSKNGEGRDVPLSTKAMGYLAFLVEGRKTDELIFMVSWESLSVYYRQLRKKAGLDNSDLRFRDTRHEATTRLSRKFSNQLELAAVTGHKSLQSLKRYYNPTAAELAKRLD